MGVDAEHNSMTIDTRVSVQIEAILLRKTEAAQALGLSPRTLDDLVLAGLIGKVQIGGLIRYDVVELREFVRRIRVEGLSKSKIEQLIESGKSQRNPSPAKESR